MSQNIYNTSVKPNTLKTSTVLGPTTQERNI